MPYLPSQARLKSDTYKNILDSDITEQQERILDLLAKQQISGSVDANNPTRDEEGFLVSIEDPNNPGQAAEGITESVRIENKQQFFNDRYLNNISQEISHFVTPEVGETEDDEMVDEVVEIQIQADTGKIPDPYRPLIVEFINRLASKNSLKTSFIAARAGFRMRKNAAGIEEIDDSVSAEKLNSLIVKLIRAFPPGQKRVRTAISLLKAMRKLKTYQVDLKIALDLRNYAVILQDFIFKNKTLRRTYKEFGLPTTIKTQTGGLFNLVSGKTQSPRTGTDDEEELRGKGYIV